MKSLMVSAIALLFVGCSGSDSLLEPRPTDSGADETAVATDTGASDGSDGASQSETGVDSGIDASADTGSGALESGTDTKEADTGIDVAVDDSSVQQDAPPDTQDDQDAPEDTAIAVDAQAPICSASFCKDQNTKSLCLNNGTEITLAACPGATPICQDNAGAPVCVECLTNTDCKNNYGDACKVGSCNQATHKCEPVNAPMGTPCDPNAPTIMICDIKGQCACKMGAFRCGADKLSTEKCAYNAAGNQWLFESACLNTNNYAGCETNTGTGAGGCKNCSPNITHTANCNLNPDDGCEVNLLTDLKNCGSCGNVCALGTDCVSGGCKETLIYSALSNSTIITQFRVDNENVYFSTTTKGIQKVKKNDLTANAKQIISYRSGFELYDKFLYIHSQGRLIRFVNDGTGETVISPAMNNLASERFLIDPSFVWTINQNYLGKIDKNNGSSVEYALSTNSTFVQNATHIFYTNGQTTVNKFNKATGAVNAITSYVLGNGLINLAYGGNDVYSDQSIPNGEIRRTDATWESSELVLQYGDNYRPGVMAFYNGKLWVNLWKKDPLGSGVISKIVKIDPITKAIMVMLTRTNSVVELAVDASGVYWTEYDLYAVHNIDVN